MTRITDPSPDVRAALDDYDARRKAFRLRAPRDGTREWRAQCAVVAVLRLRHIRFAASLNGVRLPPGLARRAKAAGCEAGHPDLLIYDPPPALSGKVGTALEMKVADIAPKTERAGEWSGARPEQREWLDALTTRGWHCVVGYGAADALAKIRAAGYAI